MAEVKWIKLTTDMFDNRKIKYLRRLPDGDSIVLIWVMLLTMAGRCNAGGMIFLTENIPYTPKMLADELDFEESTVVLALQALDNMDMIVTKNGNYAIAGWEEYQNTDRLQELREYNRLAQQKSRAKRKALEAPEVVVNDKSMTSQCGHDADIEEDKEKEIDLDIDNKKESVTCKQVVDLFHSICISFPKIRSISDARKKAIKARLNTYSLEDFKTVFENAEASSFLKGSNDRNWTATFDWLIKDSNMAKVLEGNYADKASRYGGRKEKVPGWLGYQHSESELDAIRRVMEQEDPEAQEERDQLARELQESFGRNI
jgi:predicted phage replisome organizer